MKRPLILTCSLCSHYEPNRSVCSLKGGNRNPLSTEAIECKREGVFCRYMYVIPDAYNYYSLDEEIPVDWKIDYSRLHTDSKGIPLFVNTKRGIEKAIPANESVKALKGDMILGVQRIFTYQGQREMICEIGVELAKKEAENARIELTILPEEKGWAGIREYKVKHNEQRSTKKKKCPWISKQAIELWD